MLKKGTYLQNRRAREGHASCLRYLKSYYAEEILVLRCAAQRAEQKSGSDRDKYHLQVREIYQ